MPQIQRDLEEINLIRGAALSVGGRTVFSREFPMGEGWYKFIPRVNITVTIGTGTGAIAEGELRFIKNLLLRTDRSEILCDAPGRQVYKIAHVKSGSAPRKDAVAAASATYRVTLPLFFVDDKLMRPEDTIVDTARYNTLTLDVQLGTVADLFTTVGTSSVVCTLDVDVLRSKGILPEGAQPLFFQQLGFVPPVDAASLTTIDLERSPDLAYKRLFMHASSAGAAGVPWGGANADDVQDLESMRDQSNFIVQERVHEMIQDSNKDDYSLEAVAGAAPIPGLTVFDFVRDGSLRSALMSGDKSRLQYNWTNKAGVAANDIVTVGYEAIRSLK